MNVAVISAAGIGDGLLMHTIAHHLHTLGHEVTTINSHLAGFGAWLQGCAIQPHFAGTFDAIVLQHDNSPRAKELAALPSPVYIVYGSHIPSKHGPLRHHLDYVCNPNITMLDNLALASTQFFGSASRDNGLCPPPHLIHRKYPRRIAIHPTSSSSVRNWPKKKFLKLAAWLEQQGYEPHFTVSPPERKDWPNSPLLPTLEALASFLYESAAFLGNDSGPGHLASYLHIPTLTLGSDTQYLRLWRPGWLLGECLTPPAWLTYFKWPRRHWHNFLPTRLVMHRFKNKVLIN